MDFAPKVLKVHTDPVLQTSVRKISEYKYTGHLSASDLFETKHKKQNEAECFCPFLSFQDAEGCLSAEGGGFLPP